MEESAARGARERPDGPSDADAMGLEKRRQVRGGTYGPTRARIAARFAIFVAVAVLLLVGGKIAVDVLDKAPETDAAEAPWAQPNSPQRQPNPIQ
ncbi:MAG: hypothetical protein ACRDL3_03210 [Solirubrobacterales bacterium]